MADQASPIDTAAPADVLAGLCGSLRRVLLTGPADPDGDSIGSCLALQMALAHRFPELHVDVSGQPGFRYAELPNAAKMLVETELSADYDLVLILDGDRDRLHPRVAAAYAAATTRGIIDHHRSTKPEGYDYAWIAPEVASTCEMILQLVDAWNIPLYPDLAMALYTGFLFDTGGFRHSNTTAQTLRLAARLLETGIAHNALTLRVLHERREQGLRLLGQILTEAEREGELAVGFVPLHTLERLGADYADLEGAVETLLHIEGVELAALLTEREPGVVRLSLRSRARVDVAELATRISPKGGGHRRAAGAQLALDLNTARQLVSPLLRAALRN
jgi:phosphoesterase RecJ-like protein